MKSSILLVVFTAIQFFNSQAQAQEAIDARLVLKGSKDTLSKKLVIRKRTSTKEYIEWGSIYGVLKFQSSAGEIEKIKQGEIQLLEFNDLFGIKRVFVDRESLGFEKKDYLMELVYSGTISFYRAYEVKDPSLNLGYAYLPGDKETGLISRKYKPVTFGGPLPNIVKGVDYFIYDDYPIEYINLYEAEGREYLAEMTSDRPEIADRIVNVQNYEDLVQILKDYDTDPEIVRQRIDSAMKKNAPETKTKKLSDIIKNDSVKTKKIESASELQVGDFIKYVGPGDDKFGLVSKILSSKVIRMEYNVDTEPQVFTVRVSDIELIID